MSNKFNSEKERLLCYASGLIGSYLANPHTPTGLLVEDWMIKRAIKYAHNMITTIYDDAKLAEILK